MTSIVRSLTAFPTLNVNRSSGASRLPLELWREIFHHATYVPGGYDTLLTYVSCLLRSRSKLTRLQLSL